MPIPRSDYPTGVLARVTTEPGLTQATVLQTESLARSGAATDRDLVRMWHDEVHHGGFDFCTLQPCHALARFEPPPLDWGPEGQCPYCGCGDPRHAR